MINPAERTTLPVMIVTILVVFWVVFGSRPARGGYDECEFGNHVIVISKLSGLKGMVVTHHRNDTDNLCAKNCGYDVRFVTESGWIYTIEKMRPYELEWPSEPKTETPPAQETTPTPPISVQNLDFGG